MLRVNKYEVHSNSVIECLGESVVGVTHEKARLAYARVANKHQFEEAVAGLGERYYYMFEFYIEIL